MWKSQYFKSPSRHAHGLCCYPVTSARAGDTAHCPPYPHQCVRCGCPEPEGAVAPVRQSQGAIVLMETLGAGTGGAGGSPGQQWTEGLGQAD